MMRKYINPGDVFEIKTPKGLAYFQYVEKNDLNLALIRILPGLYQERPVEMAKIVEEKELYYTFFPLSAAKRRKIVVCVENTSLPPWARQIPVMRKRGLINADGKVMNWFIINGVKIEKVNILNDEQKKLSIDSIWNDTLLIERISSNWRPEQVV